MRNRIVGIVAAVLAYDHIADADVLTALDPTHPQHPLCTAIAPVVGG
jgi:hypothetical protein